MTSIPSCLRTDFTLADVCSHHLSPASLILSYQERKGNGRNGTTRKLKISSMGITFRSINEMKCNCSRDSCYKGNCSGRSFDKRNRIVVYCAICGIYYFVFTALFSNFVIQFFHCLLYVTGFFVILQHCF